MGNGNLLLVVLARAVEQHLGRFNLQNLANMARVGEYGVLESSAAGRSFKRPRPDGLGP